MFIINGIDVSSMAHGCQKRGRPLDPLVEYAVQHNEDVMIFSGHRNEA